MIKDTLNRMLVQKAAGPTATLTIYDLFRAIELIAEEGPIGRNILSRNLEIGGGAVRTLIKRLQEHGLITISKPGCIMTEKGRDLWKEITSCITKKIKIKKSELSVNSYDFAILLKNQGEKVTNGLVQRDSAIRAGALSATTMIFRDNRLVIPKVSSDISLVYPEIFNQINERMSPIEKDVIIVVNGENLKNAENGALAAALTIV